jgi:hypothetical protein
MVPLNRSFLVVGVVATLAMDLLTGLSVALRCAAPLPPNLIGRWFAELARGRPIHADIAQAPAVRFELAIALAGHYAIGTTLAFVHLWVCARFGLSPRRIGPALGFAACTNLLPWLVMFPALGYGFFGSHGPEGTRLFVSSLISHACFGVGLWLAARVFVAAPGTA